MNDLKLSIRFLLRDWRAGDLRVLALAVIIAVASMTSVDFFTDRVQQALNQQAAELLGADLVMKSSQPVPSAWVDRAQALGLRSAQTITFPSVIVIGDAPQLVAVKAVTPGYPLRGSLRVAMAPFAQEELAQDIPATGEAWLDARLMGSLQLAVGDRLTLGSQGLRISRVLTYEPDRGGGFINLAPRVMINQQDVVRTGLLSSGSRANYYLLLTGAPADLARLRAVATPDLEPHQEFQTVDESRPELRSLLERANKFLGLAALAAVLLAGVATATAAHRYVIRHLDNAALWRCFGVTQTRLLVLFAWQIGLLGLAASLIGCLLGYGSQYILVALLADLLNLALPPPSARPIIFGLLVGLTTLLGFAMPLLLRLKSVPPLRVLRRDLGPLPAPIAVVYASAILAVAGLMAWQTGDSKLVLYLLTGGLVALLGAAAFIYVLIRLLHSARQRVGVTWRFGLINVVRRAQASVAQVLALSLGIMALLVLSLVRTDLLATWQTSLPARAPNQFVINVQPEQIPAITDFFRTRDIGPLKLYPMTRARLIAINDRPVSVQDYTDERAQRLVAREFNLSWSAQLPEDNRIVAGQWWPLETQAEPLISVEEGIAKSLKLKLGDMLTYNAAGQILQLKVANLRTVEWESFRANFFVILPPGVLPDYGTTYMTSFYLDAAQRGQLIELIKTFPNVTIIDVDAIMTRVRSIMQQVNLAVEYVFLFTLFAGLIILYAAIQASRDVRLQEAAILRVLGASRVQIWQGLAAEFIALGLLAGGLAALAAELVGRLLASKVFHITYQLNPWIWVVGLAAGLVGVTAFGLWGTRAVVRHPPWQVLRETQ